MTLEEENAGLKAKNAALREQRTAEVAAHKCRQVQELPLIRPRVTDHQAPSIRCPAWG